MARRGLLQESKILLKQRFHAWGPKPRKLTGRQNMKTPCVKICVIHTVEKICVGCYRTREEIAQWQKFTEEEQKTLMESLINRKKMIYRRRGGKRKDTNID